MNCTTSEDFPGKLDVSSGVRDAEEPDTPTEREPRTAIFLFLRMSPAGIVI